MPNQSSIIAQEAIRKGSVKVLVGDNFDSLVEIGAIRNPEFTSLAENQSIEFDNTRPLKKFVKGSRVQLSFELCEINLSNIAKLDAGLIELTTVAGTLVEGAEQVITPGNWAYNKIIYFANQNGNGSAPDVNSVVGSVSGALAEGDDYIIAQGEGNKWGILIIDSGSEAISENQVITIDYDYTPNEAKRLAFNDYGTKSLKALRIENVDENDKVFRIDISDGTNFTPVSINFAADDEDNVAVMPIQFEGYVSDWLDEQQVS